MPWSIPIVTITNPKLLRIKNEKKVLGFSYSKNMANFEAFHYLDNFIKHKTLISEECKVSTRKGFSRIRFVPTFKRTFAYT